MTISESQLRSWSQLGAQVRSQRTYESIQNALTGHAWPPAMGSPSVYLQGSYRNHTNIAGDSDVDVVVEASGVFHHNLSPDDPRLHGYPPGAFSWENFRDEVYRALASHYSQGRVRQGNKCIHVGAAGDRLNADVVPCCQFRGYGGGRDYATGITFWTRSGVQVVNYPKLHYDRGAQKNDACAGNYKPMVRVYKNARNAAESDFPSYFLECLLYNVSPLCYSGDYATMFSGVLADLLESKTSGSMGQWLCQNGQQFIFGTAQHQVDLGSAHRFVDALVGLWVGSR